ncbi:bifunctional protein GlmU [Halalkalicoccus paucihalophilus]|uniref:Bifunctional protein GlmU n=1 Tax=Halalkalicoccus paucihalophilus TaxID=1008153 RepID=A0A151ABK5_9EURY|nr:NDP-sugar synthase [Halalkalicoccus paucihalophilus]KYH24892.1 bifunctional protein GlmU [Halalkalicoccus paucihalophilus]
MKAIVLAGGYATRLWPITKHRPKMFLPMGDDTVIDRIFKALEDDERISEVFVSTNESFESEFASYLTASEFEKPTLSIEGTTREAEKLGVVGALAELVERENIDEDTLVIAGDNVISFDLSDFLDFFETKDEATLAAYDVESREQAKSYGLVDLEDEQVTDFQEKPDDPTSTLVSIACYGLPAETLPRLDEYLDSGNNPDEPGWFIQWLHQEQPVYAYTFDEAWFDIGTPESYLEALEWHMDGENYVADGAVLEGTDLGTNAHVLADAKLRNTTIEHSVVFDNATVEDSQIDNSLIDREATVHSAQLEGALVGEHSRLYTE